MTDLENLVERIYGNDTAAGCAELMKSLGVSSLNPKETDKEMFRKAAQMIIAATDASLRNKEKPNISKDGTPPTLWSLKSSCQQAPFEND